MDERFFQIKENKLQIGGVDCDSIAQKFGTPIYVYNQDRIENITKVFIKSLQDNYGYGDIHYASKAFSCKEIYRIMKKLNTGIDVVSGGELFTAKSVDFPMEKIIFHGNNKSIKELNEAINEKVGLIVIDSISEASKINKICDELNTFQNILIRVNPGIEAHTHEYIKTSKTDSKFGFSIDSGEAENVIQQLLQLKNIRLKGIHCHIGSQILEHESFILAAKKMIEFYSYVSRKYKVKFDTLDLGGGFGIWYNEDDKEITDKDYYDFIKEICITVKNEFEKQRIEKPRLIFEPGRALVGEAGITLYTIGSIKEIKNLKTYLAVDGGMFENPRFALYQAKYTVVAPNKINDKPKFKYSIAGKCCESGDKIREDCFLPKMEEGDLLATLSTGAYHYSMASNYNRNPVPPVIFIKNGEIKVVVKAQDYNDLLRNDV